MAIPPINADTQSGQLGNAVYSKVKELNVKQIHISSGDSSFMMLII